MAELSAPAFHAIRAPRLVRIMRDTVVQKLTECRLKRGRQRHNPHCLLPLIGYFELLSSAIFHAKNNVLAIAHTAKELIVILCLLNLSLVSPETTHHWGFVIRVWSYGRPTCGRVAYSCQPKLAGLFNLSFAMYNPPDS